MDSVLVPIAVMKVKVGKLRVGPAFPQAPTRTAAWSGVLKLLERPLCGLLARKFKDHGHMQGRVIKKYSVRLLIMLSKTFAVIADHNDQGIVIPAVPL